MENCYICGCTRNVGIYLNKVLQNIHQISTLFKKVTIIIYYDISDDDTLYILENTKLFDIKILTNKEEMSPCRTSRIAKGRNALLDEMIIQEKSQKTKTKFFIMMDMDDVCSKNIDLNILNEHLIMNPSSWDSVSFNLPDYYDIWALSLEPYMTSCWSWNCNTGDKRRLIVNKMKEYVTQKLSLVKPNHLLQCSSAFNGFAIYRLEKFTNCSYDNSVANNMQFITEYEYLQNINALENDISNDTWSLVHTDDCEHRFFHMQAIKQNNAKIMISPKIIF
jgi:hypothetical protein